MIKENSALDLPWQIAKNNVWIGKKNYPPRAFEKPAVKKFLNNDLLVAQNEEILNELAPHLENVTLGGHKYLYQPGDHVDYIYFPETAVVSEFQILEDGRTVEIAMIGSEGALGLLPIFDSYRATNWTQVSVGGSAARIDSRIFEKKIFRHYSFQKRLFEYVNTYVGQVSQRFVCNRYHLIEQRFCSWLLMLQDRRKNNRLPLTQEQIARALGVHRPNVTHIAQTLRAKKIIDYIRGNIYIIDRPELEKSSCGCFFEINKTFADFC